MIKTEIHLIRFDENRSIISKDVAVFNVNIPKGFITDGASVPTMFRWYMSPYGKGFNAALAHDYKHLFHDIGSDERDQADFDFYWDLVASGFTKFTATFPYLGVRMYTTYLKIRKLIRRYKLWS